MNNLDQLAAQYAQNMVTTTLAKAEKKGEIKPKEIENLVTKTLGVLQEQGVYACMLFLFSRTSTEAIIGPFIRNELYTLLKQLPVTKSNNDINELSAEESINVINAGEDKKILNECKSKEAKKTLRYFSNHVCNDLDTLLLVKELYEQTLIYARYGAKAAGGE